MTFNIPELTKNIQKTKLQKKSYGMKSYTGEVQNTFLPLNFNFMFIFKLDSGPSPPFFFIHGAF